MKKSRILGVVLIIIGFLFILNSLSSITGFAVAESIGKGASSLVGIALVIGGVLMFISKKEKRVNKLERDLLNTKDVNARIKLVERAHSNGIIDDVKTANMVNEIFDNKLDGMVYKHEVAFTVRDGANKYSLGESKRDIDLAYAFYNRIIANNHGYKKN